MPNILVNGMVSIRDRQPYLQIAIDGKVAQCSMAEARNVARDIERMCARTEADAMIYRFFDKQVYPPGAAVAVLREFRDFRSQLDAEAVEKSELPPEVG